MRIRTIRRRNRRRAVRLAAATAIVVAGTQVASQPGSAFTTEIDQDCRFTDLTFSFFEMSWTPSTKAAFLEGAAQWREVLDDEGNQVLDPDSSSSSAEDIVVTRAPISGTQLGEFDCNTRSITIDDGITSLSEISAIAQHEVGHAFGLEHTGDGDSLQELGTEPAMTTCPVFDYTGSVGQDDDAQVNHLYDPTTSDRSGADSSFEAGRDDWWVTTNLDLTYDDGTASAGETSGYIVGGSGSGTPTLRQAIRNTVPGPNYAIHVAYKDGASNNDGAIGTRLEVRRVSYGAGDTDCGWVNDWDLNTPTMGSWSYTTSGTTWTATEDDWQSTVGPYWSAPSTWEGVDVRMNVYKGTEAGMWIDEVRVVAVDVS